MDWTALTLYLAVMAITPGPNNLMTLYLSASYGLSGAKKFIIASSAGYFAKLLICGALNVALARTVPAMIPYLKWVGALYMVYLALMMLRSGFRSRQDGEEKKGESTYRQGIVLQCLNMKSWVCTLSVYSVYVVPHTTALGPMMAVAAVNMVLMLASTFCWGAFGSAFRRVYREHSRVFSVIFAASLIWCAVTGLK